MLPAATARIPAAVSISATSVVTVVFPLVPVMATRGAAEAGGHRPGQLDLGVERHPGLLGEAVDRMALGHAGARHHQVGSGDEGGQLGGRRSADDANAERFEAGCPLGHPGRGRIVVDHGHRPVGRAGPGHRLARHTDRATTSHPHPINHGDPSP